MLDDWMQGYGLQLSLIKTSEIELMKVAWMDDLIISGLLER